MHRKRIFRIFFIFNNSTGAEVYCHPSLRGHPSIRLPLDTSCGQCTKIFSLASFSSLPFQDNDNCSLHDGSQEVSPGRTELHPGDRELWVGNATPQRLKGRPLADYTGWELDGCGAYEMWSVTVGGKKNTKPDLVHFFFFLSEVLNFLVLKRSLKWKWFWR